MAGLAGKGPAGADAGFDGNMRIIKASGNRTAQLRTMGCGEYRQPPIDCFFHERLVSKSWGRLVADKKPAKEISAGESGF
ncbi:hypothetical protein CFBP5499_19905 [Agrobacterium tumefaciens]|nr:hypothetical protein CFBP5499_19905 [Agrobacterium tumefaciens]